MATTITSHQRHWAITIDREHVGHLVTTVVDGHETTRAWCDCDRDNVKRFDNYDDAHEYILSHEDAVLMLKGLY